MSPTSDRIERESPDRIDLPDPNDDGSCTTDDGRDGQRRTCDYSVSNFSNVHYDPTVFELKTVTQLPGSSTCQAGVRMPSKF